MHEWQMALVEQSNSGWMDRKAESQERKVHCRVNHVIRYAFLLETFANPFVGHCYVQISTMLTPFAILQSTPPNRTSKLLVGFIYTSIQA